MILLVDFNDSFTYNIASYLDVIAKKFHSELVVVSHKEFSADYIANVKAVVLGPGPGHPSEYKKAYSTIKSYLEESVPIMGVCLGHQILMEIYGLDVGRSQTIAHAEEVRLTLPDWQCFLKSDRLKEFTIQRYNSLSAKGDSSELKLYKNDCHEVMMSYGDNLFSIQYHPESVGTSCPWSFFRPLEYFLYNKWDECKNKT